MKIEFPCPQCQSVLRLDEAHCGKPARCPVCGCVSSVPHASPSGSAAVPNDSGWVPLKPPQLPGSRNPVVPAGASKAADEPVPPLWKGNAPDPNPVPTGRVESRISPIRPAVRPVFLNPGPNSGKDGFWVFSLVCGILAVAFPVWICACGGIFGLPVSLAGLSAAVFSRRGPRTPLLILNLVGLALSSLIAIRWILSVF